MFMSQVLFSLATVFAIYAFFAKRFKRVHLPYPPGPPGYPIIGNLFDVPRSLQWKRYTDWAKQYGGIVHINVLGRHLVVLNTEEAAYDLLEKRSGIYSDRPDLAVMNMNGWHVNMGLKHYGDEWRHDRRVLHQQFRREAAPSLHPLELAKSQQLLRHLLSRPQDFEDHFQIYPASMIMYLLYGHEASSFNDPLMQLSFEAIWLFSRSVFPGTNIINIFPPLRHLPKWMPVLKDAHDLCAKSRHLLERVQCIPFDSMKRHIAQGTVVPSWASDLLEKNARKDERVVSEDTIKALGVSTFAAATEAISSFLSTFVLAMILFPDAQTRAQEEIDQVIGNARLPNFDDRESLPFIEALCREIFRWHGPAPLGAPHACTQDDTYKGYYIPKESTRKAQQLSLTNGAPPLLTEDELRTNYLVRAMWRDERVYPEPEKFKPERFLNPDGTLTDQRPPAFGFGRRVCAGRSMGDASVWIAVASILSVFSINKAKDASGRDIEVSEQYCDGIVSSPLPFQCSIVPRSEHARELITNNPPVHFDSNVMYY